MATAASAVVHLAGQPTEAPWPVIRDANIEGTFAGLRGRPPRRRPPDRATPRPTTPPGSRRSAPELPADVPAAPGHSLRREQGLRRGARPLLRRPVRPAGRLPAHRHVRGPAATSAGAVDLAVAGRLRPAGRRLPARRGPELRAASGASQRTPGGPGRLDAAYALGYRPRDDAEAYAGEITEGAEPPGRRATSAASSPRPGSASTRWRVGHECTATCGGASMSVDDVRPECRPGSRTRSTRWPPTSCETCRAGSMPATLPQPPSWPTASPGRSSSAPPACAGRCGPGRTA